jgi:hypothetical protein
MDTGPCFNDPHPANKRVDMALVDVAATEIVVEDLMMKNLDYRYPVPGFVAKQKSSTGTGKVKSIHKLDLTLDLT